MEEREFPQEIIDRYPKEELERVGALMRQNVIVKDRTYHFKRYANVFLGKELVTWLIENGHATTVDEAILVGDYFLSNNVFHHV